MWGNRAWTQPRLSPEELDMATQQQRQDIINQYVAILNDLNSEIAQATIDLDNLKKDLSGVLAQRNKQYEDQMAALETKKQDLIQYANQLQKEGEELSARQTEVNNTIEEESKRIDSSHASLSERMNTLHDTQDKIEKTTQDLEQLKINVVAEQQNLAVKIEEHKDLLSQVMEANHKLGEDRQSLAADREIHNNNVSVHQKTIEDFAIERQRIMDFYDALLAKEQGLEPLKKSYEDGLTKNQIEEKRLRDENIKHAVVKSDAEKRILAAKEAEIKANEARIRLEDLKEELHSKINPGTANALPAIPTQGELNVRTSA